MATLIGELPKSNFIRLNRRLLTDRLKNMYGKELADEYIELLRMKYSEPKALTNLILSSIIENRDSKKLRLNFGS
jgi:ribonucleoside-triphosphate reductase